MKTQTKSFSLRLISDLLDNENFVNIHSTSDSLYTSIHLAVDRYKNNVSQNMLYAIENDEGYVTILDNNIVKNLIAEYKNKDNKSLLESRRMGVYDLQICMLYPGTTEEEINRFKFLAS